MNFTSQLQFLAQLANNNHKDWFHSHQDEYHRCRKEFTDFITELIAEISSFDHTLSGLEAKNCIFRVNRDLRFSKDKTPYKTNFSAYLADGGKKSPKAGYYFHLQPDESFIAGGIWTPPTDILNRIRQEIDYNTKEFVSLTQSEIFTKTFGQLEGERLKSTPKGYASDHPLIDTLRLKSFLISQKLPDQKLKKMDVKEFGRLFQQMFPIIEFINRVFDDEEDTQMS